MDFGIIKFEWKLFRNESYKQVFPTSSLNSTHLYWLELINANAFRDQQNFNFVIIRSFPTFVRFLFMFYIPNVFSFLMKS